MKKMISVLIVIWALSIQLVPYSAKNDVVISDCVGTSVAYAAGPENEEQASTITVTVDDIAVVAEQLQAYNKEIDMLAQLIWSEARGVESRAEQAAVVWCVLNRVDAGMRGDTIAGVVISRAQFAYRKRLPVTPELRALARDVLIRWLLEKRGFENVGRVLPKGYLFFAGRRGHNRFRTGHRTRDYWDWSLPDPYAEGGQGH